MPSGPGLRKIVLLAVVCIAHAGLLFSFNAGQRKSNPAGSTSERNTYIVVSTAVGLPKSDSVAQPVIEVNTTRPAAATSPNDSALREQGRGPESPYGLRLKNMAVFLDADAVDQTARPDDHFEILLGQRLPLRIESMVLEFWIDDEGITVQVQCLEGACNDATIVPLTKLAELRFAPAIKNGTPVASRKVMQIDPLPTFGL